MKKLVAMIMMVLVVISMYGAHAEASRMDVSAITSSVNVVRAFHAFERSLSENMANSRISTKGSGSIAIDLSGMDENTPEYNLFNLFAGDLH